MTRATERLEHSPGGRAAIDPGISAGGGNRQSAEVVRPAFAVFGAFGRVGKTAMRQTYQGAAVLLDQVDLDETRSRRDLLPPLPTEAVGEPMDRHDFAERTARRAGRVAADAFDEVESARMRLGRRLGANPA